LVLAVNERHQVLWKPGAVHRREFELQSQRPGRQLLVRTLIDNALVAEMDSEEPRRPPALCRERRDGARVDPAAEEGADGDIRHQLLGRHLLEELPELLDAALGCFLTRLESVGVPIHAVMNSGPGHLQVLTGPDLLDVLEERAVE
jgi:hypothetical protein